MKCCFVLMTCCLLILLIGVGTVGSQDGRGLVRIHADERGFLQDYIYPRLYRLHPNTGELEGASADNLALVVDPQPTADRGQTLRFRDDLRWSDGSSITAWDGLRALLNASQDGGIEALGVQDDYTLIVRYTTATCANTARLNPAVRATSAAFVEAARAVTRQSPALLTANEWVLALHQQGIASSAFIQPGLTAGLRLPDAAEESAFAGWMADNLAVRLVEPAGGLSREEAFRLGETQVLFNPFYKNYSDLLALDDVQAFQMTGWTWEYLILNFADTEIPRSAFTTRGQLLDQGQNQFFSDTRLRQAVALALDVETMIQLGYYGNARRFAGTLPPNSWGHNPAPTPVPFDPSAAGRLLDEAGWVDTNGDGIRNCYRCQSAEQGSELMLSFANASGNNITGELMALQLGRVGIGLQSNFNLDLSQQFDLMLVSSNLSTPSARDPDQWGLFAREADVLGASGNVGSYYNPVVESLLDEARTLPGCVVAERQALYQQVESILAEELPIIPLYTLDYLYMARGVDGFDPRPDDPFWNLPEWRVTQ